MTLLEKQTLFTHLVSKLIQHAYFRGYKITFGEAYRTLEQAQLNAKSGKGISKSLHTIRLAVDLNLFKDGKYLTDSAAHKPLGDYWKTLHPLCRWGGDFKKPDGNHYSIEHDGIS